jgi:hypothetical protein
MSACDTESWGLVERFFIDDGELDGMSPSQAFVLGVEWEMVRHELLHTDTAFERLVQRANVERVLKMCWGHKRKASTKDTEIAEWVTILVGPKHG